MKIMTLCWLGAGSISLALGVEGLATSLDLGTVGLIWLGASSICAGAVTEAVSSALR